MTEIRELTLLGSFLSPSQHHPEPKFIIITFDLDYRGL